MKNMALDFSDSKLMYSKSIKRKREIEAFMF